MQKPSHSGNLFHAFHLSSHYTISFPCFRDVSGFVEICAALSPEDLGREQVTHPPTLPCQVPHGAKTGLWEGCSRQQTATRSRSGSQSGWRARPPRPGLQWHSPGKQRQKSDRGGLWISENVNAGDVLGLWGKRIYVGCHRLVTCKQFINKHGIN